MCELVFEMSLERKLIEHFSAGRESQWPDISWLPLYRESVLSVFCLIIIDKEKMVAILIKYSLVVKLTWLNMFQMTNFTYVNIKNITPGRLTCD